MIRAHRIRLNPTNEQAQYFWRCCGIARFTWNWALAEYNNALARGEKPKLLELKKEFNRRRNEDGFAPFVAEVQSYANQYAFQDLQSAISRYFDLKKKGKLKAPEGWKPRKDGKPFGWPRFKARSKTTPAFGLANNGGMKFDGHNVTISKCSGGLVNMAEALRFDGKVMGGRVSYTGGHWYLAVQVEIADVEKTAALSKTVGIDLGIKYRAVTSDGVLYNNPRALGANQRKMARLQRSASRMWLRNGKKLTSNWRKIQAKISALHERIANIRREHAHEMTTELVNEYGLIGVEDLNIKGMAKNRKLAKAISDAGMYQVRQQLGYKAESVGCKVVVVDRWFASSKTCSACGEKVSELPLSVRRWICPSCGGEHERDGNAAVNIRNEAVRLASMA